MSIIETEIELAAQDGHRYRLLARLPQQPRASLLWLPALGVAARHYLPFADALSQRGVAVFLHEMRGNGSSSLRASREIDWGYRDILAIDVACSEHAVAERADVPVRIIGGHSIGAQFAACYLGLNPQAFHRLWLVASGSPYWRNFPAPQRYGFPMAYQFIAWVARLRGTLPGRQLGFAGEEARSLMQDWVRVGLSNRYAAAGMQVDLEHALSQITADVDAVLLADDWFAPPRSMQGLLDKMPAARTRLTTLHDRALGSRADHFAWMKQPDGLINVLLDAEFAS